MTPASESNPTLDPGYIIADLLASTVLGGYEREKREWLYLWEVQGCQYLLQRIEEETYHGNLWTSSFVRLNAETIREGKNKPYDFNLKAAAERGDID